MNSQQEKLLREKNANLEKELALRICDLQVEAALENVRSRSLTMHNSEELQDVVTIMFRSLAELRIEMASATINVFTEGSKDFNVWVANANNEYSTQILIPYFDHPGNTEYYYAKENGVEIGTKTYSFEEKYAWWNYVFVHSDFKYMQEDRKQYILNSKFWTLAVAFAKYASISVSSFTREFFSENEIEVFKRFTKVFDQAYTRFLDLQKAEAQAREAQIEASLERVRARTMAMHESSDLLGVINMLADQFQMLGFKIDIADFNTSYRDKDWNLWLYNPGTPMYPEKLLVPYIDHPFFNTTMESLAKGSDFNTSVYSKKEKDSFLDHLYAHTIAGKIPEERKKFVYSTPGFACSTVFLKNTALTIANYDAKPYTEEQNGIIRRFGNVFEQAYTRFLDLQRAEAQAQEAQIQLALERVRARTMAMQRSEELSETVYILFQQFRQLGENPDQATIGLINEEERVIEYWVTLYGKQMDRVFKFSIDEPHVTRKIYEAWKEQKKSLVIDLSGSDLREFSTYRENMGGARVNESENRRIINVAIFSKGLINVQSNESRSEESIMLLERFAAVFDQTYTRFLDLQRAEMQAKEAQIEAALERVRGKAMAMHSSRDLADTIGVFYSELHLFSITPRRCGVGLLDREDRACELYTWNTTEKGESLELIGRLRMEGHPVLDKVYESWISQTEYHPILRGQEISEYYKVLRPQVAFPDYFHNDVQYGYFFFFNEGGVYAWTEKEMNEDEMQIYRRFTSVLSLTYKRYSDLQNSEARAKEAIKQAALDRIRAEIASMRIVGDLDRITPLIWNELTVLGIPFSRCGVFIMDEANHQIHTFLSTPDGKAIAAFHLPYTTTGNFAAMLDHWRRKKVYIDHWSQQDFSGIADILVAQGGAISRDQYLNSTPREGIFLHLFPFLQGMLYVANSVTLPEDQINLIQSVADAFSTAYSRYEDFKKLEAAKQQTDKTLVDLRQTQQQLIQTEKMASLGELTAGIAHEIQNPLNFVNNFSEVTGELLNELNEESIHKLPEAEKLKAKNILTDAISNLEKIIHHGKRADAIVKGMIQHSRSSTGQMEQTDINALADEYLRLSFHALRVKDNSFNITLQKDFDKTIGNVNVVTQDIGRVLLNLYNNAFYAVLEKKKAHPDGYEPLVSVSTKKVSDKIEIRVKDNGNGIPKKIVDKIFQPFFTTKPTGQGTGLGLSLSYDIVKAHGGEIKVDTKEGECAQFTITLPS